MTSFVPNGAPGQLHTNTMAKNAGVARSNTSAVPHPTSGRTTNPTNTTVATRGHFLKTVPSCSKVVLKPADNIVDTMKTTNTMLNRAVSVSTMAPLWLQADLAIALAPSHWPTRRSPG